MGGEALLIGVAAVWNDHKGLDDYIKLAFILPDEYYSNKPCKADFGGIAK